jgi:hypothetical protein
VDGQEKIDRSWGMSAPQMAEKHQKDAQTIHIEAQNASISVNTTQNIKIIVKINCDDSKS